MTKLTAELARQYVEPTEAQSVRYRGFMRRIAENYLVWRGEHANELTLVDVSDQRNDDPGGALVPVADAPR